MLQVRSTWAFSLRALWWTWEGVKVLTSEPLPWQPLQVLQGLNSILPGPRAGCRARAPKAAWFAPLVCWNLIFLTCCRPAVSWSSVSPLPYRPLDLRWQLFQGNSRTLIRNRPGLMDGRKLAPASRSEGVILNYSDLLGGEQVRGGFRSLPPSKTCGRVPEQSKTDTSSAIPLHHCLCPASLRWIAGSLA